MRRNRFSSLTGAFLAALGLAGSLVVLSLPAPDRRPGPGPVATQEVTFYTSPAGAALLRELPKGEATPLEVVGYAGRPVRLEAWADQSGQLPDPVRVFFELPGYRRAQRDIPLAELRSGVWPGRSQEMVKLEPESPVAAVQAAVRQRPGTAAVALAWLLATLVLGWRAYRKERRGAVLEELSAGASDSSLVGRVLKEFRLVELIGEGGCGQVYRAVPDRTLDTAKSVAIKVLRVGSQDEQTLQRLEREVHMCLGLTHPNVVKTFEQGAEGNLVYLVMEDVVGRTLDRIIPPDGLPRDVALRYLRGLAQGLAHAHSLGIVHRDVKPANVIVTPKGSVKLLDFGFAKKPGHNDLSASQDTLGTPAYIAPEQIQNTRIDARADQYSFGCVAYELLCGRPPHGVPGEDSQAPLRLLVEHLSSPVEPLGNRRPEYAGAVSTVLNRMLEKDPAQRYDSIELAFQALECALNGDRSH